MAPTSSFVPIADPVAERRLYLSMIGLLFIVLEFLRRVDVRQHKWMMSLAAVLLIAAGLTHNRNYVWGDKVALWEDAVAKSPNKARVQFQLAQAYFESNECAKALPHYARSAEIEPGDDRLYTDWGLAYDCLNQPDEAVAKIRRALSLKPTAHGYSQLGMIFGKNGKYPEALDALAMAAKIDPNFDMTYVYRGDVHLSAGDPAAAVQDFRQALAINPQNQPAMHDLALAESRLGNRR
jgi:tetratricopeptide (TPR) repeat protein